MRITAGLLNLALAMLMIAISLPCYLGRVAPNPNYGFRIEKPFASEENWYQINRFWSRAPSPWS